MHQMHVYRQHAPRLSVGINTNKVSEKMLMAAKDLACSMQASSWQFWACKCISRGTVAVGKHSLLLLLTTSFNQMLKEQSARVPEVRSDLPVVTPGPSHFHEERQHTDRTHFLAADEMPADDIQWLAPPQVCQVDSDSGMN